jgi:hypothetical protein
MLVRLALSGNEADSLSLLDLDVCCDDDYQFQELVHVAQIIVLKQTQDASVALRAAYQAGQLRFWSRRLQPMRASEAASHSWLMR